MGALQFYIKSVFCMVVVYLLSILQYRLFVDEFFEWFLVISVASQFSYLIFLNGAAQSFVRGLPLNKINEAATIKILGQSILHVKSRLYLGATTCCGAAIFTSFYFGSFYCFIAVIVLMLTTFINSLLTNYFICVGNATNQGLVPAVEFAFRLILGGIALNNGAELAVIVLFYFFGGLFGITVFFCVLFIISLSGSVLYRLKKMLRTFITLNKELRKPAIRNHYAYGYDRWGATQWFQNNGDRAVLASSGDTNLIANYQMLLHIFYIPIQSFFSIGLKYILPRSYSDTQKVSIRFQRVSKLNLAALIFSLMLIAGFFSPLISLIFDVLLGDKMVLPQVAELFLASGILFTVYSLIIQELNRISFVNERVFFQNTMAFIQVVVVFCSVYFGSGLGDVSTAFFLLTLLRVQWAFLIIRRCYVD